MLFSSDDTGLFNADFLSKRQTRKLLSTRHTGVCVNGKHKMSLADSFRNLWICGNTGSGKTTNIIIPTLLNEFRHSAVVLDPSGEIHRQTSGYLQRQGFDLQVLNLGNSSRSLNFNPITGAHSSATSKKIAHLLVESAYPDDARSGRNAFWNQSAKELLFVFISLVRNLPEKYRHLAQIRVLLDSFGSKGEGLIDFVTQYANDVTYRLYTSFLNQSENLRLSVLSTAKTALEKFSDDDLAQLISRHTVDFSALRQGKSVLFLQVPENEISYYSPLLAMIYAQLFDMAMQLPEPGQSYEPILFLMDEFANSGIHLLDNFVNICTSSRKRQVSLVMIGQDQGQIEHLFGKDKASAILNGGTATHLFLSGQSIDSAREIEQRLGRTSVSYSSLKGKSLESHRPLLAANEIVQLPKDRALLFHANLPAVLLKMRPYYLNSTLRKRAALPPAALPESGLSPVEYVSL